MAQEDKLLTEFRSAVVGARVKSVSYMTKGERNDLGFHHRGVVIEFDNGTMMFPMADDEGNDVGALSWDSANKTGTVGVIT